VAVCSTEGLPDPSSEEQIDAVQPFKKGEARSWAGSYTPSSPSPETKGAISAYVQENESIYINRALRQGKSLSPKREQWVANLDGMFSSATPIDRDIRVFRGVERKFGKTLSEGKVFADDGFMSTSLFFDTAEWFTGGDGYVLEIVAKKGSKAVIVETKELELLFSRGQRIRILHIDRDEQRIVAEILS